MTGDPDPRPAEHLAHPQAPAAEAEPVDVPGWRGAAFLPLMLGGMLAAAAGFGAAMLAFPDGWGGNASAAAQRHAELAARIESLDVALAAQGAEAQRLAAALAALETTTAARLPDPDLVSRLEATMAEFAGRLEGVETRITTLAATPDAGLADTARLDDLRSEIAALRDAAARPVDPAALDAVLADARAEIATLAERTRAERATLAEQTEAGLAAARAEVEATARDVRRLGAILRIEAAIEAGTPFARPLDDLAAEGVAIPAGLRDAAGGVATLASLQASFPDAARAALAAGVSVDPQAPFGDRVLAFLRVQTGARSLSPRAGADPDAVLARAEAALRAGDLGQALAELDTLAPAAAGAAVLAEWRGRAGGRQSALAAVELLRIPDNSGKAGDGD